MAQPADLQRGRLGLETTPGVSVSANRVLRDVQWDADPNIPEQVINPIGYLVPTDEVFGKEFTDVTFTSEATSYETLTYLFNMFLEVGVITTPGGGTNTRRHTFDPPSTAVPTVKTATLEIGPDGGTAGRKCDYMVLNGMDLTFNENTGVAIGNGKAFARELSDGVTITTDPTEVAQTTIQGPDISFYVATSVAGLGAGQVKPNSLRFSMPPRWMMVPKIDASEVSYATVVPIKTAPVGQMVIDADDADTLGLMTKLRAATQLYGQIVCEGPIIEGALPYKFTLTFPFKFRDNKRGNDKGLYAHTVDMMVNHVSDFNTTGGYLIAVLDNQITAL